MKSHITHGVILAFIAAFCLLGPLPVAAGGVLLLHSTDHANSWTDALNAGIAEPLGNDVHISPVYLGSGTEDDDYFDDRFEALSAAWQEAPPSVVITDGSLAFAFIRKYREGIFADVPVIYCGMPKPRPEAVSECGSCTGIPMILDVEETVDLIFHLRPSTSIVVGIMDGSEERTALRERMEEAMRPYLDHAQIIFPGHEPGDDGGLDLAKLQSVASSVPGSGAVLYLGFERDSVGDPVDETDVVHRVAIRSAAPVFGLTGQWMETGMLGGFMVRPTVLGREVGRLAQRVLDGQPISEMLPEAVAPQPVVDLTVLARFGISQSSLPQGVLALNAPETPQEPTGVSSTGLGIAGGGLVLLVALFVFLRRSSRT